MAYKVSDAGDPRQYPIRHLPDHVPGKGFPHGFLPRRWSYVLDTMPFVRGAPFQHRDVNRLVKVADPTPNPLMPLNKNWDAAHAFRSPRSS